MRRLIAAVVAWALLGGAVPARAEESTIEQIGYGTGSVVGSAVYFPFKAAFCILGGLGGGAALVVAGSEPASRIVNASCRGTWAITPDIVKGRERVRFVGEAPDRRAPARPTGR